VVEAPQWRYRECLRNHAARLGAHVLDGCCEFMPSGSDGAAALACAACGCHRSFHRREAIPGGVAAAAAVVSPSAVPVVTPTARASANSSRVMPLLMAPPHMHTRPPHVPASPASAPAALTESSSEELRGHAPAHPAAPPPPPPHAQVVALAGSASAPPAPSKKRFRTKFTAEQKDRMREFAHRVGWRIHKPDADAVDVFCAQVGVSRRVLKVWMHNNKHLAKVPPSPPSSQAQAQAQPPPPPQQHRHHNHHPPPPPPHHIHHHHHPPPPQQQEQQHDMHE
jgi:ZF-HD class homeobox domain-containing protein